MGQRARGDGGGGDLSPVSILPRLLPTLTNGGARLPGARPLRLLAPAWLIDWVSHWSLRLSFMKELPRYSCLYPLLPLTQITSPFTGGGC